MTDQIKLKKLTLWEALKELGWVPILFAVFVGGPSSLSILESLLVDHKLVPALQWIVDGFNRVSSVLDSIFNPLVTPIIEEINRIFKSNISLHPIWKGVFALLMSAISPNVRFRGEYLSSFIMFIGAIFASLLFGLNASYEYKTTILTFWSFFTIYFSLGAIIAIKGIIVSDRIMAKTGLSIISGFVAAGIIFTADWIIKGYAVS